MTAKSGTAGDCHREILCPDRELTNGSFIGKSPIGLSKPVVPPGVTISRVHGMREGIQNPEFRIQQVEGRTLDCSFWIPRILDSWRRYVLVPPLFP
jgi:hypothetical protein